MIDRFFAVASRGIGYAPAAAFTFAAWALLDCHRGAIGDAMTLSMMALLFAILSFFADRDE